MTTNSTPNLDYIPQRLSGGAAALVSLVDRIVIDKDLPTCGVACKDDTIVLYLGRLYMSAPDELKSVLLEHEAGHIALSHDARFRVLQDPKVPGDEQYEVTEESRRKVWNLCADSGIHHRCMDPSPLLSLELDGQKFEPITFDNLGQPFGLQIPPCTPESAYDLIMREAKGQASKMVAEGKLQGCGREGMSEGEHGSGLPKWASAEVAVGVEKAAEEWAQAQGIGTHRSIRPALGAVQDPPPAWMTTLINHLERTAGRKERARSWRRLHRYNEWLPGRARTVDRTALVLVDCSGSISQQFLQTTVNLLAGMKYSVEVCLWAVDATERISVREAISRLQNGTAPSGGTDARLAGTRRQPGQRSIWITDGYVSWCDLGPKDFVLYTDDPPPSGIAGAKI